MAENSPKSSNISKSSVLERGGKFSVADFASKVSTNLLVPNTYALVIPSPAAIQQSFGGMQENLTLRIDNLELPGKQLATDEVQYYGPPRKSAYGMIYEDLTFNVYLSKNLEERNFFSEWMDLAIDYDTAHVSYYDDIVTDCKFYSYSRTADFGGKQATTEIVRERLGEFAKKELNEFADFSVTFEQAYPISIGQITYAYASDEVARLPVTMAYRKWKKFTK
jgi:hypothetical protein